MRPFTTPAPLFTDNSFLVYCFGKTLYSGMNTTTKTICKLHTTVAANKQKHACNYDNYARENAYIHGHNSFVWMYKYLQLHQNTERIFKASQYYGNYVYSFRFCKCMCASPLTCKCKTNNKSFKTPWMRITRTTNENKLQTFTPTTDTWAEAYGWFQILVTYKIYKAYKDFQIHNKLTFYWLVYAQKK